MRPGLLALGLAASCAAAEPTPTAGLPATLRVLVAAQEHPEMYSFAASGPPGFERELLEGFCRLHGLRLQAEPVQGFEQILPMLLRGEADLAVGIVDTPARREKIAFTAELLPVRHVAISLAARGPVGGLEDLRRLRVGVIPNTSWEAAVAEAGVPPVQRVPFHDSAELLGGLRAGKVEAVVMPVIDFSLAQKRYPELVAGVFVGTAGRAAIGLHKDAARLLAALDAYLRDTQQARQALLLKYLSQEALTLIARARRE